MTRQVWLIDHLFKTLLPTSGITSTILNPGYFADNYLRVIPTAVHLGILPILQGQLDSWDAPPSNEDIARVAVAVLLDPSKHAGKSYRPTGPKLLSGREMVSVITKVLGKRQVVAIPLPSWLLMKAARMDGSTIFEQSSLQHYIQDHKDGVFAYNAPTNHVLEVTGQMPEDFETTVRRYLDQPRSQKTVGNTVKEFVRFMRTPFAPGYDVKGYERRMGFPQPQHIIHPMQDQEWRAAHIIGDDGTKKKKQ